MSVRKREWVNRGFLHGPVLPIYGSGALIVLLCTISVRDQMGLIFLFGMVGATLLEYVTGACMERLFRVRYWDYSHLPLNVHGYICLPVSLGWGAFSVFLMRGIHVPVETLVLGIPDRMAEIVAVVCSSVFAVDFTLSFGEAMDLRDLLARLTDSNEKIHRLQKRLEVVSAFAEEGVLQYQARREARRLSRKEFLEGIMERQRENRRIMLVELMEKVNEYMEAGQEKREELQKVKAQIEQEWKNIGALTNRSARHSARLLHRIPAQIIAHNAGRKDKFLEAGTPCLVAEEQRHGCKTALLLFRRNGFGKQRFIMIFQQILGNGTTACYVEHTVPLALQADW